jgi:DNA-binding LacI/PurR family transcriptional regulator
MTTYHFPDGFLWATGTSGESSLRRWYVRRTLELGFEFVLFDESDDDRVATVTAADRDGARRLTEHLIARGHTRIAFAASAVPWPMVEQRLLGYRDALRAAGIRQRRELELFAGGWTPSTGADCDHGWKRPACRRRDPSGETEGDGRAR